MNATDDTTEETTRLTTVHNRYHICCSCCGLVETEMRKRPAIGLMIAHMSQHPEPEDRTFAVYDSMHRGGGRTVYGGRIYGGVKDHGIGVGHDARTGR